MLKLNYNINFNNSKLQKNLFKKLNLFYFIRFFNIFQKNGNKKRTWKKLLIFFYKFYKLHFYKFKNKIFYFKRINKQMDINYKPSKFKKDWGSLNNFFNINWLIFNFFSKNIFFFSFFIRKKKAYVFHQRKTFDNLVGFISLWKKPTIYYKFFKILYINKNYRRNIDKFILHNLYNPRTSSLKQIFKHITLNIVTKDLG